MTPEAKTPDANVVPVTVGWDVEAQVLVISLPQGVARPVDRLLWMTPCCWFLLIVVDLAFLFYFVLVVSGVL